MRRGVLLVPMAMLAIACSAPSDSDTAVMPSPPDSTAQVRPLDDEPADCDLSWEWIATAVEAHYSETGFDVTTLDELTPAHLPWRPTDWTLEENPGEAPIVIGKAGGPCDGYTGDVERIPQQPIPPERQNPPSGSGLECFVQQPMLSGAVHAYAAEVGTYPTNQDILVDAELIPFEFELYDFNGPGSVAKTFDGDCFVRSEELPAPFDGHNSMCFSDVIRLRTAVESHRILTGFYPESVDALIEREYIFGPSLNYSTDGSGDLLAFDPTFCPGPIANLSNANPACHVGANGGVDLCLRVGS